MFDDMNLPVLLIVTLVILILIGIAVLLVEGQVWG